MCWQSPDEQVSLSVYVCLLATYLETVMTDDDSTRYIGSVHRVDISDDSI